MTGDGKAEASGDNKMAGRVRNDPRNECKEHGVGIGVGGARRIEARHSARARLGAKSQGDVMLERVRMGAWVRWLALLLTACVARGRLLNLHVSQSPGLEKHDQKIPAPGLRGGHCC